MRRRGCWKPKACGSNAAHQVQGSWGVRLPHQPPPSSGKMIAWPVGGGGKCYLCVWLYPLLSIPIWRDRTVPVASLYF